MYYTEKETKDYQAKCEYLEDKRKKQKEKKKENDSRKEMEEKYKKIPWL